MMKSILTIICFSLIGLAGLTSCKRTDNDQNVNQPSNTAAANRNGNSAPADNLDMTGYSLASPSDTYRTAMEARKKCDIQVLKRSMSETMLDTLTQRGNGNPDGKKTLDDMVKLLCDLPQSPNGEIKDEKMIGDEGTVKFKDETGEWRLMDFIRENGEWKITMPRGNNELPALK
jgi:hypothetical protein